MSEIHDIKNILSIISGDISENEASKLLTQTLPEKFTGFNFNLADPHCFISERYWEIILEE